MPIKKPARPSAACISALERVARLEGLILDPVYTGKAFAGLLDLARRRDPALGDGEPIIFLHTGGIPALFSADWGW